MASFWKPEFYSKSVLSDRSILIGQKLVENAKIEKLKCDILGDFQTLCGERKVGQEKNEFHAFHEFNKHKDDDEKTT